MACTGNNREHCCWFKGKVCAFLEENTVPGRHWVCGLYRKYGDWERVHVSEEYVRVVQPNFDSIQGLKGMNCGTWPQGNSALMAKGRGICCYGNNK